MSKRPLAALCALLAFVAALVAVPLATAEPAEAHDVYYWKTVRTCIVDPPINHCTTKRVRLPAHHKHLPATCPAGTTGTPPNCVADKPTTTTDAPPPTTPPKQCPAGSHRYGNGCHSHGFTPPSCGTGTWIPHAGHSITFLQPCPTTTTTAAPPPTTTTAPTTQPPPPPPDCIDGSHRHARNSAPGTSCHLVSVSHCPSGQHEHTHGSGDCHKAGPRCEPGEASHWGRCLNEHCPVGEHEHTHGSGDCHSSAAGHCKDGEHVHVVGGSRSYGCHPEDELHCEFGEHSHGDSGCHSLSHGDCEAGEHEHASAQHPGVTYFTCHPTSTVHYKWTSTQAWSVAAICGYPAGKLANWLIGVAVGKGCEDFFEELGEGDRERWNREHDQDASTCPDGQTGTPPNCTEPNKNGKQGGDDDDSDDSDGTDDDTDGTDDDSGEDSDDDSGDDDSGDDSDEDADPEPTPDPKPTAAEIKQNDDELNEAARRYRDEEITLAEYQAAFRRWMRWRCEEMGQTKWCNR